MGVSLKTWVCGVLATSSLYAAVVDFSGQPAQNEIAGTTVKTYPLAKVSHDGLQTELKLSGSGIRKKTVLFVPVNVYYAASYVQDLSVFQSPQTPLDAVKKSPTRVLFLTLLRSLSGSEIRDSFIEALDVNGVDVSQPVFNRIFEQFNFDGKPGNTFIIATYPKEGTEVLYLETPNKTEVTEEAKFLGLDFWKVWFGIPVDSGLADLQKNLIGKN